MDYEMNANLWNQKLSPQNNGYILEDNLMSFNSLFLLELLKEEFESCLPIIWPTKKWIAIKDLTALKIWVHPELEDPTGLSGTNIPRVHKFVSLYLNGVQKVFI